MSNKNNKSLILNNIKEYYKFKSNTDFASFLGIAPQTLSSWYSRNTFDYDLLYSKCVGINGDYLLSGNGNIFLEVSDNLVSDKIDKGNREKDLEYIVDVQKQLIEILKNRIKYLEEEKEDVQGAAVADVG